MLMFTNDLLASASGDKLAKIWSIKEKKIICELKGHINYIRSICLMGFETIVTVSDDETIIIWN